MKTTPQVAGITSQEAIVQGVRDTVSEQMGIACSTLALLR
jgi:hypothetical protein